MSRDISTLLHDAFVVAGFEDYETVEELAEEVLKECKAKIGEEDFYVKNGNDLWRLSKGDFIAILERMREGKCYNLESRGQMLSGEVFDLREMGPHDAGALLWSLQGD